ncbi:MAG TPA: B-box zinc finger protein [Candidatus Sulfotelmatobacter sp.]|nr:B-box zinc finger protein [Candidatus Sulfotelmatobacter sp.]HWI55616.1 B-box zinc finger protein [Bacillota bacterium]
MNSPLLECPQCHSRLTDSLVNQRELAPCPACTTPLQAEVFPAFFRRLTPGRDGEALIVEGESSCFYHPQKKAVVPCEGCGRFLCALCDCELHGQHFCPACLEVGRRKGKIKSLENERTLYDSIALALALYPLVFVVGVYFTFITAPMALYIAVRYWKAPLGIVRRSRARYVVALVAASLQVLGWMVLIYFMIHGFPDHG